MSSTEDDANDRSEHRCGCVFPAPATAPAFPGLMAFGRINSTRTKRGGKTESKTHYVVLSQRLPAWRMLSITRRHWSVENHLHRSLDVVFREDDARTRKDNAPGNLSVIRRTALDILRAHPLPRSIARKMNLARWNKPFFFELFSYVRSHPSPHFPAAIAGMNTPAFDTAWANFSISGSRRCSGMLGMSS